MKVILPVDILNLENGLTYTSNIAVGDGDPSEWSAATNYSVGTRVRVSSAKKTYENVVAGSEGISPHLGTSTHWVEVGYMNKYAMFDTVRRTQSFADDSIDIVVNYSNAIDSVALLGLVNATSVYVKMTDSNAATVYEVTGTPLNGTYILSNLPATTNFELEVSVLGPGKIVYVGTLIIGKSEYLGDIQRSISVDSRNYSTIDRDVFGNISLVPRGSSPISNKKLVVAASRVNAIERLRSKLNAVPAVWIGMDGNEIPEYYTSLVILGFYRKFTIRLDSPIHATISLELEEV